MGTEDYTRKLLKLLASHKGPTELTREGMRILEQINEDIEDLRVESDLIRKVIERSGAPPARLRTTRPPDTSTDLSQRQTIRQVAVELAEGRLDKEVEVGEITTRLEQKGIKLGVKKPNSVVGSIVARTKGFSKVGGGRYRYKEVP